MTESADNIRARRPRSIIRNTGMNAIAQFASIISTLVFFPLLVQAFGVADYGVYVIALSVTGMALMFDFGIAASTIRLVAHRVSLDDHEGYSFVVSTATALLFGLGLVVACAIAAVALFSPHLFSVTSAEGDMLRTLLLIGAAAQIWYWPASIAQSVLSGLERYDVVARTSLISTLLNVAAIAAVLVFNAGPVTLMALAVGTTVVASLINIWALARITPLARRVVTPSPPVAREIIVGGLPIFVAGMAQFFNREQADRLIIGAFIGPLGVTAYEVAAKLSMLIAQLNGLATSAVLPVASGMAARGDIAALRSLFMRGGRVIVLAVTPVVVTLVVLAGPFIHAWFGSGFGSSVVVAMLLVSAQIFVPLYQTGDPILISTGQFARWARWGIALALLNVGLSIALVSPFGVVGVALGTVAATVLEFPLYARIILREVDATWREWLSCSGVGYLVLPLTAAVAYGLSLTRLGSSLPGVALAGAVAVTISWVAAYAALLTDDERQGLWERVRGLRPELHKGNA